MSSDLLREAMSTEPAAYIEMDIPQEYRSDETEHQKVAFWEWCLYNDGSTSNTDR